MCDSINSVFRTSHLIVAIWGLHKRCKSWHMLRVKIGVIQLLCDQKSKRNNAEKRICYRGRLACIHILTYTHVYLHIYLHVECGTYFAESHFALSSCTAVETFPYIPMYVIYAIHVDFPLFHIMFICRSPTMYDAIYSFSLFCCGNTAEFQDLISFYSWYCWDSYR